MLESQNFFVMLRSAESRDPARVGRFVVARIVEADRETVQPVAGLLRRESRHGSNGIETAGEKQTDRHVAPKAFGSESRRRTSKSSAHSSTFRSLTGLSSERNVPVASEMEAASIEEKITARLELSNSTKNGVRRRDVTVGKIFADRKRLQAPLDPAGEPGAP